MWLQAELILRLLLAAALGGAIGWERERARRPAGLRTVMLVAVGSALFTVVSIHGFPSVAGGLADPARVAAQIVTGIGFLGAGTLFRTESTVKGLTTAASIWAAAAVGMTAAVGMYLIAVVATLIVLGTLRVLREVERKEPPGDKEE